MDMRNCPVCKELVPNQLFFTHIKTCKAPQKPKPTERKQVPSHEEKPTPGAPGCGQRQAMRTMETRDAFKENLDQLLRAPPHEANNRKGGLPMEMPLSPTDEPPQRSMDVHPLDEQLKEALREISDLKSKNAKLADDLTEAEIEIRDLKKEHSTVQDALKNTSEQLTATMNELQNSKNENERLVEEVTGLKKRLENTEEENKRLVAEVASFNQAQITFNASKDVTRITCGQTADPPADSDQPASLPFPSLKMIKCPRCHQEFTRKLVGPHIKNCKGPRKAKPTQKQQVISPEHNRQEHLKIQVTCENSVETTESCPMEWQAAMLQNKEEMDARFQKLESEIASFRDPLGRLFEEIAKLK